MAAIQTIMVNNQHRFRAWFPEVSKPNPRADLEITLTGIETRFADSDDD